MALILALLFAYILFIAEKIFYRRKWHENLDVSINFDADGIPYGGECVMGEVVTNGKRMPLHFLDIKFSVDSSLKFEEDDNSSVTDRYYRRDVFSVPGGCRITRKLKLAGYKRGYFTVGDIDVITNDYLYSERQLAFFRSDAALMVYPKRVDRKRLAMVYQELLGDSGRLFGTEDPFSFRGMRDYMYGDSPKAINQKVSARTGVLTVNLHEYMSTQKFVVICDLYSKMLNSKEELLENVISISVSLAEDLIYKGMETAFVSGGKMITDETKVDTGFGKDRKLISEIDKEMALTDISKEADTLETVWEKAFDNRNRDIIYIIVSSQRAEMLSDFVTRKRSEGCLVSSILAYRNRDIKDLFAGADKNSYAGVYPWEAV